MYNLYGIWVDHAHAFVVKSNKGAQMEVSEYHSDVESHHKGGQESNEHQTLSNQTAHEHRRENQMKAFAKELVQHVQDADELVLFGPGTAKHELKHEVERNKALASKLKGVETTDKLTEHELKDFVKTFFKLPKN